MDESEFIFQPIQDELHCRIENLENVIARTGVIGNLRAIQMMPFLRILLFLFIVFANCQCTRNRYFCGSYHPYISSKSEIVAFASIVHEDTILAIIRGQVMGKFITSKANEIDTLHYAAIEFRSLDLAFDTITTTDSNGFFEQYLNPGTYNIACSYTGMNTAVITNTTIGEGEVILLIFMLGTGNSKDAVNVK